MTTNPKDLIGRTKPPMRTIPPVALLELGMVMADGEKKYGLMNWREHPVRASVYYDALMRHAFAFWDGENLARDSKRKHLAHIMGCCAILLDAEEGGHLVDDRPRPGKAPAFIDRNTVTKGEV